MLPELLILGCLFWCVFHFSLTMYFSRILKHASIDLEQVKKMYLCIFMSLCCYFGVNLAICYVFPDFLINHYNRVPLWFFSFILCKLLVSLVLMMKCAKILFRDDKIEEREQLRVLCNLILVFWIVFIVIDVFSWFKLSKTI